MAQLDIVYVSFTAITTKYGLKHLAKHNLVNSVSQLFYCNPLNLPYIKHWIDHMQSFQALICVSSPKHQHHRLYSPHTEHTS